MPKEKQISTPADWRSAQRTSRASRAERLTLPSGATILAARPEPLEWILAGRLPQRLLAAALGEGIPPSAGMTREDVLELARFAAQLIRASVVAPAIGDGPEEIRLDDIPVEDRAFIFEWACRATNGAKANSAEEDLSGPSAPRLSLGAVSESRTADGLERFCAK